MLSLELGTRLAFSASQYLADAPHRVNIWDKFEKLFIMSNMNLHFWCEFWEAILHSFEEENLNWTDRSLHLGSLRPRWVNPGQEAETLRASVSLSIE